MTTALITIPRRRPALNLRFIGWVFAIFRESFAHQQVIYRRCVLIRTFLNTFMNRLGLFFKKRQKGRKEKEKNAAQLGLKIVNNIAL